MKNSYIFLIFLFFGYACTPHKVEAPNAPLPPPDGEGKADGATSDLKKIVEHGLAGLPGYKIFDSSIPIGRIWDKINYKSFDYETFFYNACPNTKWQGANSYLACDYQNAQTKRKFSISVYPEKIVIDIKELSFENNLFSRGISAIWEIEGSAEDFTVKKYEILRDKNFTEYGIISSRYIKNRNEIIAKGQIGSAAYGAYSFETKDIIFTNCDAMPGGKIIIEASPETRVNFFESRSCDGCAPVVIGGYYGKFSYCGPFGLRDLFDYLHLYLQ